MLESVQLLVVRAGRIACGRGCRVDFCRPIFERAAIGADCSQAGSVRRKPVNPLEQVNSYLQMLERRLRWGAVARGAAVLAVAALLATVLLVLYTNAYAFSDSSLRIARVLLAVSLALAAGFGLILPIMSLNQRRAARRAESAVPEFDARLLTFAEKKSTDDPFLELLAADTMQVAHTADPGRIVSPRLMFGSASAAAFASLGLIWLILAGPGFFGHGASLLWAGAPREGMRAGYYDIVVTP